MTRPRNTASAGAGTTHPGGDSTKGPAAAGGAGGRVLSVTTVVVVLSSGGVALADVLVATHSKPHRNGRARNGKAAHRTSRISATLLSTVLGRVSAWPAAAILTYRLQSASQTSRSAQRHRVRRFGSSLVRGAVGVDCARLTPFRSRLVDAIDRRGDRMSCRRCVALRTPEP